MSAYWYWRLLGDDDWESSSETDPDDVAARGLESVWEQIDHPDTCDVEVRAPDGTVTIYEVTVEMDPTFFARERKGKTR